MTLEKNIDKGYHCDDCGQFVKRYRRSFNANMALALIAVHKESGGAYVHLSKFLLEHSDSKICGDATKLVHYGMLERKPGEREDGSLRNGYYRITKKGRDFVLGEITAPQYCIILNNVCEGFSGKEITIVDALGVKFNYNELMKFI